MQKKFNNINLLLDPYFLKYFESFVLSLLGFFLIKILAASKTYLSICS